MTKAFSLLGSSSPVTRIRAPRYRSKTYWRRYHAIPANDELKLMLVLRPVSGRVKRERTCRMLSETAKLNCNTLVKDG